MKKTYKDVHSVCLNKRNHAAAINSQRFFKTKPGEYGEGDIFFGISVPEARKIAKLYSDLPLDEIKILIKSEIHEERLIALYILIEAYKKALKVDDFKSIKKIYSLYYKSKKYVNNWDLVDTSAPHISGHFYFHYEDSDIKKLIKSKSLWDRRIAVVSTFYFIRQNEVKGALKIIEACLYNNEDLMHKACGWMLREIGKKDLKILNQFLDIHANKMPRTALRYSLEKHSIPEKKKYMKKEKTK